MCTESRIVIIRGRQKPCGNVPGSAEASWFDLSLSLSRRDQRDDAGLKSRAVKLSRRCELWRPLPIVWVRLCNSKSLILPDFLSTKTLLLNENKLPFPSNAMTTQINILLTRYAITFRRASLQQLRTGPAQHIVTINRHGRPLDFQPIDGDKKCLKLRNQPPGNAASYSCI